MLPDNFDFAQLPELPKRSVGLRDYVESNIENIIFNNIMAKQFNLFATTNEGRKKVDVLWQTPERRFNKGDKILEMIPAR